MIDCGYNINIKTLVFIAKYPCLGYTGSFELAILRMSRYYELNQNCVLYADTLLPQEAFYTSDPNEQKLVALAFEVARGVAELKLTETELALYSACVLLSPG